MGHSFRGILALSVVLADITALPCSGQLNRHVLLSTTLLRSAIDRHLKSLPLASSRPAWFSFAFIDLADHGREQAVAYITGEDWCGTGGCTLLVLSQDEHSYRIV